MLGALFNTWPSALCVCPGDPRWARVLVREGALRGSRVVTCKLYDKAGHVSGTIQARECPSLVHIFFNLCPFPSWRVLSYEQGPGVAQGGKRSYCSRWRGRASSCDLVSCRDVTALGAEDSEQHLLQLRQVMCGCQCDEAPQGV